MSAQKGACCSSPAAICYWFVASLVAWGVLELIGLYWRPLHAAPAAACTFAMGIGCVANWLRNRTYHCAVTAPLFLIAGVVFLLPSVSTIRVNTSWVWLIVLLGAAVAFLLEWRYAKRDTG